MATDPGPPARPQNRLLATLPPGEYSRVVAVMDAVSFPPRAVVYRAGGPLRHVYFPRSGVFSLAVLMADGRTAEVGVVGRDGVLGMPAFHGAVRSRVEVVCQVGPADAWRLPGDAFQREAGRPGPFRELLHRYARVTFDHVAQTAACNGLHTVAQRCARRLLEARDRAGADEFPLTQELLAALLGVRRESITLAANHLQRAGVIEYSRGRVRVRDAGRLEAAACECYRVGREDLDRLAADPVWPAAVPPTP
jgi:CRP-like cAMP-binding protein